MVLVCLIMSLSSETDKIKLFRPEQYYIAVKEFSLYTDDLTLYPKHFLCSLETSGINPETEAGMTTEHHQMWQRNKAVRY